MSDESKPQQGDSAVASEGGSCVNAEMLAALRGVVRVADRKTAEFDAARAAIAKAEAALSTAGAQRRASEQDETTSAKEQR